MLFALIWLVGLSAVSLGFVYYFVTHASVSRDRNGHARADRQSSRIIVRDVHRPPQLRRRRGST